MTLDFLILYVLILDVHQNDYILLFADTNLKCLFIIQDLKPGNLAVNANCELKVKS